MPFDGTDFDAGREPRLPIDKEYLRELEKKRGIQNVHVDRRSDRKRQDIGDTFEEEAPLQRAHTVRRRSASDGNGIADRVRHIQDTKPALAAKLAAKGSFRAVVYATWYIAPIILAFYLMFLIALSIAEAQVASAIERMGDAVGDLDPVEFFFGMVEGTVAIVEGTVSFVSGFEVAGSLALAFYSVAAAIGVFSTLVVFILYKMNPVGIHPLGGERGTIKWLLFIGAILFHVIPFTNFAPWFLIWAWYVKKHPA